MKYAFLLYEDESRWETMAEAERMALIEQHMAYAGALVEAGKLSAGEPLEPTKTARTLKAGTVADGPYADSKEQLGGFYVVDVADEAEALEWARKCPLMEGGTLEIRTIPDYGA